MLSAGCRIMYDEIGVGVQALGSTTGNDIGFGFKGLCVKGKNLCAKGKNLCVKGKNLCVKGKNLCVKGKNLCVKDSW